MENNKTIHNIILTVLFVLTLLFFFTDGFGVYGVITMFFAFIYLLWNDGNDEDNNDDYYKFNLK